MKRRMIVRLVAVVAIATVMMLSSYAVAEQLSPAEEDAVFANATINTYKGTIEKVSDFLIFHPSDPTFSSCLQIKLL